MKGFALIRGISVHQRIISVISVPSFQTCKVMVMEEGKMHRTQACNALWSGGVPAAANWLSVFVVLCHHDAVNREYK